MLSRRVRLLYIDAREALRVAPEVAKVMAMEMHKPLSWVDEEVERFKGIAKNFIVNI